MRLRGIAIALAALGGIPLLACAQQSQLPADSLQMNAPSALVWEDGKTNVVELQGPVDIELDHTRLTADGAVVWLSPAPGGLLAEQKAQIALIGHARLQQDAIVRTETNLLVTAIVRGSIQLHGQQSARDDRNSGLYTRAANLRSGESATAAPSPAPGPPQRRWSDSPPMRVPSAPTAPAPVTVRPTRSVEFDIDTFDLVHADNGDLAAVFSGEVTLRYLNAQGDLLEFQAEKVVLFTDLKNLQGVGKGADLKSFISQHVISAYFEGDIRVFVTPAKSSANELRMRAQRIYYEFNTDRAVMTDVVFHTVDIKRQIPVFLRAQALRQLSQGEYETDNVVLSTSGFATPTYGMAAQRAYVRVDAGVDAAEGQRVSFSANNAVFEVFGLPVFYLPVAGGTMTSRGGPLRAIAVDHDSQFGYGLRTQWGLFETLGRTAPADLDAAYRLDYFNLRGFAGGLDARYEGGFVTETTKSPWNFLGDIHAYFVEDHGTDVLGASRANVKPPDEFRGRAYIEHQHFFPNDWQLQMRLGWVSDANFQQQWFPDEFRNGLPINESIYLKHQKDSEVFTLLTEWQPNDIITNADNIQEQREVERLPEVGYYRVGDSFADDSLTFFSENTASGLRFEQSSASLRQQGFYTGFGTIPSVEPGLPSFAYTGDPQRVTWREDLRQEIDWPINAGPFKFVPYVFGRYTGYSQGARLIPPVPQTRTIPLAVQRSGELNRFMAGGGARLSTSFWKVDDSVQSDLLDVHRLRHVIEPELDLFGSGQSLNPNREFIYDENVDAANAVQGMELALRQRWQTKRGGPGRWRSVDFLTLNIYGDFYAHQPPPRFRDPIDFRGQYFPSLPEASIARNSLNADALWRISDTTALLADASENLDRTKLATASLGLAVQRDQRLNYFIGTRYIADLNSNITTIEATYELTRKYSVSATESFDFGQHKSVYYTATLTRKFDRFQMGLRAYYDASSNDSGVSFNFFPYGLQRGVGTDQVNQLGP